MKCHSVACLLLLPACAMKADENGNFVSETGGQSVEDSATPPEDTAMDWGDEPTFQSLDAVLSVVESLPVAEGASLSLSIWGTGGAVGEPMCSTTLAVDAAESVVPPVTDIWAWWKLTVGASDGACDGLAVTWPTELHLGVGTLANDIAAVLGSSGYEGLGTHLLGAYVALAPEGTPWIYGVAGTASQYSGDETPVAGAVPDGTWMLRGIYLLPL